MNKVLLDEVSVKAKESPRLRMNYNFHQSLEDKCHRMLNSVEPGMQVSINRHPTKDESFVVLRGKVKVTTYNDNGSVIESVVFCQEEGRYGVDIKKKGVVKSENPCSRQRDIRLQIGTVCAARGEDGIQEMTSVKVRNTRCHWVVFLIPLYAAEKTAISVRI